MPRGQGGHESSRAVAYLGGGGGLGAAGVVIGSWVTGRPIAVVPVVAAAAVAVVALALRGLIPFLEGYERVRMLRAVRRRFEATLADEDGAPRSWDEADRLVKLSNELTHDDVVSRQGRM